MADPKKVDTREDTLHSSRLLIVAAKHLRGVEDEMRRINLDDEADTLSTTIRDLAWQCEMLLAKNQRLSRPVPLDVGR